MKSGLLRMVLLLGFSLGVGLLLPAILRAHCDTMDGPVIKDARTALQKRSVMPVLKWVTKEQEQQIRTAFQKTLVVRSKGREAKELADRYFFETLVRIHRAGEGAPFTGLKPAGIGMDPAVEEADQALQDGSVEKLVKTVTNDVATGIRKRFTHALEMKKSANDSVKAGREYVSAYIEFVHFVERIHLDAASKTDHVSHEAERTRQRHH